MTEAPSTNNGRLRYMATLGTALLCSLLVPFGAILPLNAAFISDAFAGNYLHIPQALVSFIAYMFQHGSPLHFVSNLIPLLLLGPLLESGIGSRRTLIFFLVSGILAGVGDYVAALTLGTPMMMSIPMVGFSGVIFAIMAALAAGAPRCVIFQVWKNGPALRLYQVVLLLVAKQIWDYYSGPGIMGGDKTAYAVHLSGLFAGLGLWAFWLKQYFDEFAQTRTGKILYFDGDSK